MSLVLPPDPPALLDVRAVAALLGCSPRHVMRLVASARFPKPIALGRLVRWRRTDLDAFLSDAGSGRPFVSGAGHDQHDRPLTPRPAGCPAPVGDRKGVARG